MVHAKGCPPLCTPKTIFTERLGNNRWLRYYCTKAQLILIVLSRATSLVFNGNNITSRVSLTMKMCQILSASATLSFRIGLTFCVFQGGNSKSEENARQTWEDGEARVAWERSISKKNPACPHIVAQALFSAIVRKSGFVLASFSPLFKIYLRKKLLLFSKLIISTTTAHIETATKFDTVVKVKLAGFQW